MEQNAALNMLYETPDIRPDICCFLQAKLFFKLQTLLTLLFEIEKGTSACNKPIKVTQ